MTSPTTVAVFPGQGSQRVGMGKMLAEASPSAAAVFEEVDDALGEKLSRLIFEGPQEELTLTANAQPALMATSLAAVRAFEEKVGTAFVQSVDFVAGHSLGEYSALAAIGVLSLGDATRLLRLRGEAMQQAVPVGEGAMAAILGLEVEQVEALAADAAQQTGGEVCALANDNAEGQAVLSGHRDAVEAAVSIAKDRGVKRAMLLDVSAPFHCPLMVPAAERLADAFKHVTFGSMARPLIANVTAAPVNDAANLPQLLEQQVTGRVRWRESMIAMADLGCARMIEFGAGRVLTGLARRALPQAERINIAEPQDLDALHTG